MASLGFNTNGEVCLTLRGVDEDRVLTTLRGWPQWLRADIERDVLHPGRYTAVTLITSSIHEGTLREILKRSFGMVFPKEGGSCAALAIPILPARRGARSRH